MECKWCGRKIGKGLTQETHTCRSKKLNNCTTHIQEDVVNKVKEEYSLLFLANNSFEIFNQQLTRKNIEYICKWHNVQMPTIKQAASSEITRNEYKKTVKQKYGVENVSQSQIIKKKKERTNIEKYGVSNPFQREEIIEKSKNTMLDKYGVSNAIHLPRKNSTGRLSKPHKKVSEKLLEIGIEHENDQTGLFSKFNSKLNRVYCPIPDIYIPSKKIVIEIYGDRWHMNPRFYKETDIVRFFIGERTGKETWEYDKTRIDHIASFGINVLTIWEYDIKIKLDETIKKVLDFYDSIKN